MIDVHLEEQSLQEKKRKLEEIRSLHKPLEKRELAEHAFKYEQMRVERETSLKQKRKQEILAEKERKNLLPTFRSVRASYDDGLEKLRAPGQLLGAAKEKELEAQNKKKHKEKIANYGKYVKEMYWPSVSEKNQQTTQN